MSNLIIYIPFNQDNNCDLDTGASEMRDFFGQIQNHVLGENVNRQINNINILYLNDHYNCAADDVVILFAHGSNNRTDLVNNIDQTINMPQAISNLEQIGAQRAFRVLFMCCFSSLDDHIADRWKRTHNRQTYGSNTVIGNLYSSTRTTITRVCAALQELA